LKVMLVQQPTLRWYSQDATPVHVQDMRVIPRSQVLEIQFGAAAFVWQRPVAVRIEHSDQVTETPIVDVTRIAQIALFALVVLAALITSLATRRAA
jgi:hypothetical protein